MPLTLHLRLLERRHDRTRGGRVRHALIRSGSAPPGDQGPDGREPLDLLVLARGTEQQRPLRRDDLERVLSVWIPVGLFAWGSSHWRGGYDWGGERGACAVALLLQVYFERIKDLRERNLAMGLGILYKYCCQSLQHIELSGKEPTM
jgi:hypothetical protein